MNRLRIFLHYLSQEQFDLIPSEEDQGRKHINIGGVAFSCFLGRKKQTRKNETLKTGTMWIHDARTEEYERIPTEEHEGEDRSTCKYYYFGSMQVVVFKPEELMLLDSMTE